jgi:conjugative transfer signal peptidase TraF
MNRGRSDSFRRLVRGCLVAIIACVSVFQICGWFGLRFNVSPSLPVGVYVANDTGRLVEFCPAEPFASMAITRGYRAPGACPDGGTPLLKPVIATTGDIVDVLADGIVVNGVRVPNTAPLPADSNGRPLSQWPFGRYTVSAGTVWVASSYNARSFDSRYFGPVPVDAIRNRVRPALCF